MDDESEEAQPMRSTTEANNIAQFEEIRAANRMNFNDGGNREYKKIIKKYKSWVDSYPSRDELDLVEGNYISCTALITYYLNVESKRNCNRETAERTRNALDKLAEYEGAGLSPLRTNENATKVYEVMEEVLEGLEKKSAATKKEMNKDPHLCIPTKVISQFSLSKILDDQLNSGAGDWVDVSVVWSVLSTTLMRWHNGDTTTLANLYVYKNLPPHGTTMPHDTFSWDDQNQNDSGWIMSILIPPWQQIKKNQKISKMKTELVGAYRHKRSERCVCGLIAFLLYEHLNSTYNISFLQNPPTGHVFWADVKLFKLKYSATNQAMGRNMKESDVPEWAKKTHLRKYGTHLLTAQGLSENEVNTMTKHRDNNFSVSYRAEMSIPVATILAGFNSKDPHDTYFVPRAHIQLPNNLDEPRNFSVLQNFLFPQLERWKEELNSSAADKRFGLAGKHFLFELIPWVTKILIQDGVMWIQKFPTNSALQLLKNRLSSPEGMQLLGVNYSVWANQKRVEIQESVRHRKTMEMATWNDAAAVMESMENVKDSLEKLQESVTQIQHSQAEWREHYRALNHTTTTTLHHTTYNNTPIAPRPTGDERIIVQPTGTPPTNHVPIPNPPPTFAIQDRLNPSDYPDLPTIWNVSRYTSLKQLVQLKVPHKHDSVTSSLLSVTKNGPLSKRKDHWVKIKRIYKRIEDRVKEGGENVNDDISAADDLDKHERKEMNLNAYAVWLMTAFDGKYSAKRRRVL